MSKPTPKNWFNIYLVFLVLFLAETVIWFLQKDSSPLLLAQTIEAVIVFLLILYCYFLTALQPKANQKPVPFRIVQIVIVLVAFFLVAFLYAAFHS